MTLVQSQVCVMGPSVTLNPFESNVTFLYPLKMSENLWFSDVFRGYKNVTLD